MIGAGFELRPGRFELGLVLIDMRQREPFGLGLVGGAKADLFGLAIELKPDAPVLTVRPFEDAG